MLFLHELLSFGIDQVVYFSFTEIQQIKWYI